MDVDKFIFFTDCHLANKKPSTRIDDYNEEILKKISYVIDYAVKNDIENVICGGDLADSHSINDKLMVQFVDIIKVSGVKLYFLYGNHDIQGGNTSYIDHTAFGLLSRYDFFYPLDGFEYVFKHSALTGFDYSVDLECCLEYEYPYDRNGRYTILVVHAMITNEPTLKIDNKLKSVSVNDVSTGADLLLTGHYHIGFKNVKCGERFSKPYKICNPGSIARTDILQARESYGPRFAVITVGEEGVDCKCLSIPHKSMEESFDVSGREAIAKKVKDKENFIESLSNVSKVDVMSQNAVKSLNRFFKKMPKQLKTKINNNVKKICVEAMNEAVGDKK